MPWTSQIDPGLRLIYTRVSGALTRDGALAHGAELAADPDFDPTFNHVLDLRGVDSIDLETDDVVQLASRSVLSAPARQAIVASSDVVFGISRMYEAYRQGYQAREHIEVCRTLSEAKASVGTSRLPGQDAAR